MMRSRAGCGEKATSAHAEGLGSWRNRGDLARPIPRPKSVDPGRMAPSPLAMSDTEPMLDRPEITTLGGS
jgi:hypothetical protein